MLKSYVMWNDKPHNWCEGRTFNDGTRMFRMLNQSDFDKILTLTPECRDVIIDIKFEKDEWEKDIIQAGELCDLAHQNNKVCHLRLWYVPNARMDRIKNKAESLTLKTYCKLVNAMGFDSVLIFDPHSDVAPALLDRCNVLTGDSFRLTCKGHVISKEHKVPLIVYPDAGAEHRYGGVDEDFIVGLKQRDWETSHITGYTLTNPEKMADRPILIMDDIVAHGYTMKFLIDEIMNHPHGPIYICTSHLEQSYFSLLSPLHKYGVKGMFKLLTTDSIDHDGMVELDNSALSVSHGYDDAITEFKLDDIYGADRI